MNRRVWGVGAGLSALALGAEYLSLRGAFDHWRSPGALAESLAASPFVGPEPGAQIGALLHIGHSTHLIELAGLRILTDPWFYDPAFGALSHERPPAVAPSALGALDIILISHEHPDHADLKALDEMDKRAVVLVATEELGVRIRALGFQEVAKLAPWEERSFGGLKVAAVPALHDVYEVGFVLSAGAHRVYFAGDTRIHPDIPEIAERYAPSFSILPVDGTRVVGSALQVMTPEDAVRAARLLKTQRVMPTHAEAVFSDPLAKYLLASTIPQAGRRFAELVTRDLAEVTCVSPAPGEWVRL